MRVNLRRLAKRVNNEGCNGLASSGPPIYFRNQRRLWLDGCRVISGKGWFSVPVLPMFQVHGQAGADNRPVG